MSDIARHHALPHPMNVLTLVQRTLVLWSQRRRERASLGALDSHMLRDIGLDGMTARIEAEKPFWRA